MHNILIVEDDMIMADLFETYLSEEKYQITKCHDGASAFSELEKRVYDAVLLDLKLPDMNGFDILQTIKAKGYGSSVIVITGQGSMNTAIDAMKFGASDFMVKPASKERLVITLRNALEKQELQQVVQTYKSKIDRNDYCGFIGSSLPMQEVYRIIDSAASSTATVFITGESGTGKEVCAEAIHQKSDRSNRPFCALNCGAIPRDLMESEIFGHVKGAFTGANTDREGAAAQANGGTLFLDEIGEMDLDLQTKLLRFVQSRKFTKVGGNKEISVDVRIICATNRDPLGEVQAGRFREDLYYRLHVLPIHMPALRERGEDIIRIAEHFLKNDVREENKSFKNFDNETQSILMSYDWPGNVRQLQNVVRNIVVLNDAEEVTRKILPAPLNDFDSNRLVSRRPVQSFAPPAGSHHASPGPSGPVTAQNTLALGDTPETLTSMENLERMAIENAIRVCDGSIPAVAHYLGLSAATIYRKKAQWNL
ncbi:sigma-54-dependent transcriptional regulator [Kiloniella sp. b19]|uniref:sigma-54-dependent transcriptional regulator n=1 Tax=Kiloniella sp. GXU_MW_B19 TaxID=3141326 RepID=UPI0031D7650F